MTVYYNEFNLHAAKWISNLIKAGLIAPGIVDTRSIEDVRPRDLRGFKQCHFFAGVGVWSYALRQAGWADDREVWTGSCPCQPFSSAGAKAGFDDERHLWPHFHWLIGECRPTVIYGEQVASKNADPWIDLVCSDLEALGYAFGAVPFASAGVGAPHARERTYWMAHTNNKGLEGRQGLRQRTGERAAGACGVAGRLGNADYVAQQADGGFRGGPHSDAFGSAADLPAGPTNGYWKTADWLFCRDEQWRPVEPGTFPLADGAVARMGRVRAYGNAINAEQARIFIEVGMEALHAQTQAENTSASTARKQLRGPT